MGYPLLDGRPTVWHLGPTFGGALTLLDDAYFGRVTGIREMPANPQIAAARIARAAQFAGASYHLTEQNCENLVQCAITGINESPTAKAIGLLIVGGMVAAGLHALRA